MKIVSSIKGPLLSTDNTKGHLISAESSPNKIEGILLPKDLRPYCHAA
jgi:hypothetical protein